MNNSFAINMWSNTILKRGGGAGESKNRSLGQTRIILYLKAWFYNPNLVRRFCEQGSKTYIWTKGFVHIYGIVSYTDFLRRMASVIESDQSTESYSYLASHLNSRS